MCTAKWSSRSSLKAAGSSLQAVLIPTAGTVILSACRQFRWPVPARCIVPALTKAEICELIPHRDPFLWIDEVLEVSETKIVARKLIPTDLDLFRGHYPGSPILPGVILCEAAMQAGAILIALLPGGKIEAGKVPVAARLNNVKFKQIVRPGDVIELEAELTDRVAQTYFLAAKVKVAGKLMVTLDFACTAAAIQ